MEFKKHSIVIKEAYKKDDILDLGFFCCTMSLIGFDINSHQYFSCVIDSKYINNTNINDINNDDDIIKFYYHTTKNKALDSYYKNMVNLVNDYKNDRCMYD